MPLFNSKAISTALAAFAFEPTDAQRMGAAKWAELVRGSFMWRPKETALEADFKRYVVEDVLGYRSFDASGLATVVSKEAVGSGEVDLALGNFSPERREILAPFELKGPSLENLDAIMPGRFKTPVQQAWEYANDAVGARWVIVSNQKLIRLYAVGRGRRDYETFDLARMDEPGELKRLMLILGAQQLLGGQTQALLEKSLREDKDITDQLYRDYKTLRDNLIQFIRDQQAEILAEDAIRLAQKVLDRVIFIAFAEDTVLLPNDSIKNAVAFHDPYEEPKPKWEYVKRLFQAVDGGNPRLNIPPYNGGLFAADPALDALAIPDHICEEFAKIGGYDFASQVSVAILGHIFEQSISDIEQKHAAARGETPPKTSKRKREGVVYTPDFVTRFIVEHTIGAHLGERRKTLLREHADGEDENGTIRWKTKSSEKSFWREYLDCVTSLRIVDPACGSGAFLIAAFDALKVEQTRVRERLTALEPGLLVHSEADTDVEIITQNLYGVDVNSESVEITKLSLWIKTAKKGRQLESLDHTIRWGNSLIEDSDFHRRAFDWKHDFPEIFAAGGFDIVIGNPPYVRMELIKPFKPYLERRYEVVADRADLYAYFLELGVRLLKRGGRLGYICSSFFRTGSGKPLRNYLSERTEIETVVDFGELQIFEGLTTYPIILTLRRVNGHAADDNLRFIKSSDLLEDLIETDLSKTFSLRSRPMPRASLATGSWRFESDRLDTLRRKLVAGRKTLAQMYGPPLRGIVTGLNKAFVLTRAQRDGLVTKDARSADLLKPFLVGEDLKRWIVEGEDQWLIYTPKNRIDIEEYPAVRDWLSPFREKLEARATTQNWWELQQAQLAYQCHFESTKMLWPHFQARASFGQEEQPRYLNNKCFFWGANGRGLEVLLNSNPAWLYLKGLGRIKRGGYIEAEAQYVAQIPFVQLSETELELGIQAASDSRKRIASALQFLHRLSDVVSIPPHARGKLRDWSLGTFQDFLGKLKTTVKTEIRVSERDEWERYFNARKAEVEALSTRIADAEAEINDRIYRLFELTRDEIALIEGAIAGQY